MGTQAVFDQPIFCKENVLNLRCLYLQGGSDNGDRWFKSTKRGMPAISKHSLRQGLETPEPIKVLLMQQHDLMYSRHCFVRK